MAKGKTAAPFKIHWRKDRDTYRVWTDIMSQYGQFEVYEWKKFAVLMLICKDLGILLEESDD